MVNAKLGRWVRLRRQTTASGEQEVCDHLMMRAGVTEMAFEQREPVDPERIAAQRGVPRKKPVKVRAGKAVPAAQSDVRMVSAAFGRQSNALAYPLNLSCQRDDRLARLNRGPKHAARLVIEATDTADRDVEGWAVEARQSDGQVLRHGPLDLADEAQGQVQLVFGLPIDAGKPLHGVDQTIANIFGEWQGNE